MSSKLTKEESPMNGGDEPESEVNYATAICCIDGRIQQPVSDFGRRRFGVRYVDMITKPGPVANMSDEMNAYVRISVREHHSCGIVVSAHADCAANPIDDNVQKDQCRKAAAILRETWTKTEVIPVWVSLDCAIELL
ncbi:MAG: hypothetical protein OSB70_06740 [Myxococcota bacterium]|nr:hypothetical protein [Myxococcota bacterium]